MAFLTPDEMQENLNVLLNPDVDPEKRVEVITTLQQSYASGVAEYEAITQKQLETEEKLRKSQNEAVSLYSKLTTQAYGKTEEQQKEEDQLDLQATITVDDLLNV